ncbi:thioredoxin family protein [Marinirhabdus gelatinilytica]|uniref:Thiol-disulfide isomerase/thioredoxin n=1 Tax=Marinirhabdus gelatinilytica TaxID=1703343 RepID=A0A370QKH2_9FLAO|nr:thioredoxin family protein [Marinirhabdus gelatinilytica]RDK88821.1 thiol-disulfide isomerase/thioredoxin [Marinirhabdus gelatinilytica]
MEISNSTAGEVVKIKETLVMQALENALSYSAYRDLVATHALDNTSTGHEQTEALSEYTQLNNARMRRLDKTLKSAEAITERFKNFSKRQTWLVLTESWCGDAAQSLPAIQKVAGLAPNIDFKIVLRDEHPKLMDAFLTNGSRSIPKLILFDEEQQKISADWGPRPSKATQMVQNYKAEHGSLTPEFKKDLQVWYTKDKGQNIFDDLAALIA